MIKKVAVVLAVFIVATAFVVTAGFVGEPESAVVPLTGESPCPATKCDSAECHDYSNVPVPDGSHTMSCPKVSCSSTDCHAWDTLVSGYRQASDASLNLWVLAPVVFCVALVVVVQATSHGAPSGKNGKGARNG